VCHLSRLYHSPWAHHPKIFGEESKSLSSSFGKHIELINKVFGCNVLFYVLNYAVYKVPTVLWRIRKHFWSAVKVVQISHETETRTYTGNMRQLWNGEFLCIISTNKKRILWQ
jgi:hypothetical protein